MSAKSRQEHMEKVNTVQETVKFKGPLNVLPKTMTHVTRKAIDNVIDMGAASDLV